VACLELALASPGVGDGRATRDSRVLAAADLVATAVFALEGALAGLVAGLDLLGVLVIGIVTASAGGILRDVLIGDVPPLWVRAPRFLLAAVLAGLTAIVFHAGVEDVPAWLLTGLDAAGLALFSVAGAAKALDFGLAGVMAVLMGAITGVGGGTVRDVLLDQVPAVLRVEVYAAAALAGAAVVVLGDRAGIRRGQAMILGAVVCFIIRVVSAAADWNLPTPGA
jgi:uncharacterized membrane protein YeiH